MGAPRKVSESMDEGEERLMAEFELIAAALDGIPMNMSAKDVVSRMEKLLEEHEVRPQVRMFAMALINLFVRSVGAYIKRGK